MSRNTHKRLKSLAWLMDNSVPLPGGYRIGLDGLIGLIPGFGDFVGSAVSSWIIYEAHRAGAPKRILLKMIGNTGVDLVLGMIPVIGDIFDFTFKANSRNVALLQQHLDKGEIKPRGNRGFVTLILVVALAAFALIAVGLTALFMALWRAISAA